MTLKQEEWLKKKLKEVESDVAWYKEQISGHEIELKKKQEEIILIVGFLNSEKVEDGYF